MDESIAFDDLLALRPLPGPRPAQHEHHVRQLLLRRHGGGGAAARDLLEEVEEAAAGEDCRRQQLQLWRAGEEWPQDGSPHWGGRGGRGALPVGRGVEVWKGEEERTNAAREIQFQIRFVLICSSRRDGLSQTNFASRSGPTAAGIDNQK